MRGKRIWIPLVVLLVAAGLVGWRITRGRGKEVAWRTEVVRKGDIRAQVSATGTLKAVTTVQVGSQVSGTIAAMNADFNDQVRKGQVLAQLDPTFLKAQVAQSRADLERAQVQVRQAVRDSSRIFALGAQGLSSQSELDAAQTALDAARASEQSAQAALDRATTNLRYATILSPIDGVVISRDVDVGQTVAASLSAPTLFTIANDLTHMQLEADVDEADIGQVRAGQPASFTVDSYPEMSFHGVVHQVRLQPQSSQNVVTYTVVIYVDNPEQKLLPGMTANVTVLVDEADGVLRVPTAALRFHPPQPAGGEERGAGLGDMRGRSASAMASTAGVPGADRTAGRGREGAGTGPARGDRDRSGLAGGSVASGGPHGTVYLLSGLHGLTQVRVRSGITDGTYTAVYSDSLKEGDVVVLGTDHGGAGNAGGAQSVVNPFAPRFGGPGRGRR